VGKCDPKGASAINSTKKFEGSSKVATVIAGILIVAGVALFVAAPLSGGLGSRKRSTRRELQLDEWEHEHALAVQGLRELEFDRAMGKLADADYASLRASLRRRGIQAIGEIERLRGASGMPQPAPQVSQSRRTGPLDEPIVAPRPRAAIPPPKAAPVNGAANGATRRIRVCPRCGVRATLTGKFCGDCGAKLDQLSSQSAQA
jgi:hypothetical protein